MNAWVNEMLMSVAILLPLILALGIPLPRVGRVALLAAPWAMLPALALGALGNGVAGLHWALFGAQLVMDALARGFLLLSAAVWFAAAWFARCYLASDAAAPRFWTFFLATATGNFGLIVAADVATFYCFYALMSLAAYGLIVHTGSNAARSAGRVYLAMSLLGEVLLLASFLLIAGADINLLLSRVPGQVATSPHRGLIVLMLLAGFGIKVGALLLHMWLPLAHPVAPTPASAVLSGAMIKAGVFGWLRFLPLGAIALPEVGRACAFAGILAAFYGAAVGVMQRDPKTVLAYSSMSQMGFVTAALGICLASPSAAPAGMAVILLFASHHALVKGALFLGVGVAQAHGSLWSTRLTRVGLMVAAINLAGTPLTSGALAKASLGSLLSLESWSSGMLSTLLSFAAVGTSLLMIQFWRVVAPAARHEAQHGASRKAGLWVPWLLLLIAPYGLLLAPSTAASGALFTPAKLWAATWPPVLAIAAAGCAWALRRRGTQLQIRVPPGDLVVPLTRAWRTLRRGLAWAAEALDAVYSRADAELASITGNTQGHLSRAAAAMETTLANFATIGLVFIILLAVVFALGFGPLFS